jgi:hypothetical protein
MIVGGFFLGLAVRYFFRGAAIDAIHQLSVNPGEVLPESVEVAGYMGLAQKFGLLGALLVAAGLAVRANRRKK